MKKVKIIIILGPTATGKSALAVEIARKFDGEIISADSRQIYRGLNIGTGKITRKEMWNIPHHLLDIASPKKTFSVAEWQAMAQKRIKEIAARNKIPIICGGTGFYIQSIADNFVLPQVPPDEILRKKIEKKSSQELFDMLKKLDSRRARTIEKDNPVRLIRAIEVALALGKVPVLKRDNKKYEILQIGLTLPDKDLKEKIRIRLFSRIKKGMIGEAEKLHTRGLSWKRMHLLGLEYRYLAEFHQKRVPKKELFEKIEKGNWDYARRQMTWFKGDKRILWFHPSERNKIEKSVKKFLREMEELNPR